MNKVLGAINIIAGALVLAMLGFLLLALPQTLEMYQQLEEPYDFPIAQVSYQLVIATINICLGLSHLGTYFKFKGGWVLPVSILSILLAIGSLWIIPILVMLPIYNLISDF